jgi:catechol 2,3-dioxygenase-like lactoylglutathione lyase family enzyme
MVENVEDSVDFYQKILGFSEVASVPNDQGALQFAIVARDDLLLMFQERTNLGEEYPSLATAAVKPSISLFIKVDDFEAFYQDLQSKTALLVEEHTTFYGAREFAIADNNGYVLTFAAES